MFRDLEEMLPNISMQIIKDVKDTLQQYKLPEFSEESEILLKEQFSNVIQENHRIRSLVSK